MEAIKDELKTLREQRQTVEKDMASANETLQKAQRTLGQAAGQRKEVATKIAPLEQLIKDMAASRLAIETQRKATEGEIATGKEFHDKLIMEIDKHLPPASRKASQAAR